MKEYNNVEEVAAAFVIKVDVSNIPLEKLQNNILALEIKLLGIGYAIYCVDHTQDYSGTMQRDKLINYFLENLPFRMQGGDYIPDAEYTILDNVQSVGRNVLSFIHENEKTKNLHRVKLYNKIVSNFEAGEVRSCMGGHLADYVYSSNERLRKVFESKEVQKRGITRLEVSVYGNQQDITKRTGSKIIQNVLKMVSPVDNPLFVIQEARQQWNNLAEKITKCFTLVDRPNHIIYMVWYANTLTRGIAGVKADYSKKKNLEDIEDYVKWFISDFGFNMVPIFRADILNIEAQKIIMSPLQCYIKNKDSYTILAPCNRPITVFKNPPVISYYLPPTPFVSWQWREKKERSPNDRKPKQELVESPEIAANRKVSVLGVKQREEIQRELQEAKFKVEWLDKSKDVLKSLLSSLPYRTMEDIQNIKIKMEKIEKTKKLEKEIFNWILERLKAYNTENIKNVIPGKYKILGWTNSKCSPMAVLKNSDGNIRNIWGNTKLQKISKVISPYFIYKKVKDQNIFYFVPNGEEEIIILILT